MKSKDDLKKFSQLIIALSEIFDPGNKPSALKIELYFNALEDLSIEQIEKAVSKVIKMRVFNGLPKPAEIREKINDENSMDYLNAWAKVMISLESGREPKDFAIKETIRRLGGWSWLSMQTYNQLIWVEKRFIEHFETINKSLENDSLFWEEQKLLQ